MIKLNKIVLINWMYFQEATLPLEGNTAIVGVNGTGKSTIIDAIQMLLLGNKASKFNANAEADRRTLESYVRGAINTEDKEYLRPGDVVSYIAMEVELEGVNHVFGIYIDYKSQISKLSDPRYFYFKDLELNSSLFIENKRPLVYDSFLKNVKQHGYISFPTLVMYRTKLKEILGLKDDKYFKILGRAVGLKNVDNCNKFMNDFVLDENSINVSAIQKNMLEIQKLTDTIAKQKEKSSALEEIAKQGFSIKEKEASKENLIQEVNVGQRIVIEKNIDSKKEENASLLKRKINLNQSIDDNNKQLRNLENYKNELERKLNDISPELGPKRKKLEELNKQHSDAHSFYYTFEENCKNFIMSFPKLKDSKEKEFANLYELIREKKYTKSSVVSVFDSVLEKLEILQKNDDIFKTKLEIEKKKSDITNLAKEIINLKNNKLTFKSDLENFKMKLKDQLEKKYKKQIEVKFLCEYLDITDDLWRNAIEGYLGAQKFYIVVDNKYYYDALKILKAESDLYQTRIINGVKLPSYEAKENTLGSFIEGTNTTALNFARMILNRVHCVQNEMELDQYDIAITTDCILYQGYSVGRINPRHIKEQFIGFEGIKNNLRLKEEKLLELKEEALKLSQDYNTLVSIQNEYNFIKKFLDDILKNSKMMESIDQDSILSKEIDRLVSEIKSFEENKNYMEVTVLITDNDNEIDDLKKAIASLSNELNDIESDIKYNNKEIDKLESDLSEAIFEVYILKEEETQIRLRLNMEDIEKWIKAAKITISNQEKEIANNISDIKFKMRSARDLFLINIEPEYEYFDSFIEERDKINKDIFKYDAKLVEIRKNNNRLFFSQFLTKLYQSIESAKRDIDGLNNSLKEFKFGDDSYKIKFSITSDNDLLTIYDYAKNYNEDEAKRGLFNYDIQDEDRTKVENLLNSYLSSEDPKNQTRIVDYRNYLMFDVISNTSTGAKSLNKVLKTQSGGEVQVPFYILSGVAFQQTLDYKRNKDCLGIVLYDEAFDKMDSIRIKEMLKFYREKLNLQIILAAPGKTESFVDNMETIIAVIRDGEKASVMDVRHEI